MRHLNRYLHLVTANRRGAHMYSLRRMDASRLFYPSTAEAEAAAADLQQGPMGVDALGWLPRAKLERGIHFQPPKPHGYRDGDRARYGLGDVFARFGGGSSRILCAEAAGHAAVYDAEERSFVGMPAMSSRRLRMCVAVSFPRDRADVLDWPDYDDDPRGLKACLGAHSLYVLDMFTDHDRCFEVLAYHGDYGGGWKWSPLPPPPFKYEGPGKGGHTPYAVVGDGGTTFCVSTATATYAFDTVRSEWSKYGDWVLPFSGKAEHVPELGVWFAMTRYGTSLYAVDLSGVGYNVSCQPPALCDVGLDLELRDDFGLCNDDQAVASLGAGRLCVVRFFNIVKDDHLFDNPVGVFTGVQAVRGKDDGRLRVITHKSVRFDEESFMHLLV